MMPVSKATKCCATCQHWKSVQDAFGKCAVNGVEYRHNVNAPIEQPMLTLDRALCSKWEQKEDGE